jgi:glycine/D-amino acid oxidase-like deaminating enzyme
LPGSWEISIASDGTCGIPAFLPFLHCCSLQSAQETMIRERNYWLETVREPARGVDGGLPESADVAVVGGGFCGLAASLALAKRGVNVAALEAETFGWGASCRNGGMVLTGLKLPVAKLISRYGLELARKMYAGSLEAIDLVEQIVKEERIDCAFSRCGHLEVACKQGHFAAYAEQAERIEREFGHQLRIVSKSQLRNEIGSDIYLAEWSMKPVQG